MSPRHNRLDYVYVYPFVHSTKGRIDMGQDFTGRGSILAIGKARILSTSPPPGWPEGGGVLYELLEGPKAGSKIYVFEGVDVLPGLHAGQIVNPGQTIAKFRPGGSIEIGFADARGETVAHNRGEYPPGQDGAVTRAGKEMQRFLASLGVHKGPNGGFIPSGSAERRRAEKLAGQEGLEEPTASNLSLPGAGDVASEVIDGIANLFGIHADAFMLNVALVGGGAFLVYYGAALMLGVKRPGGKLVQGAALAATKGAAE